MRSAAARSLFCAALALAAGCGSAQHRGGSTGAPPNPNQAPGAGATTTAQSATGRVGLQPSGTPKFAKPDRSAPVRSGRVRIAYRNITIRPNTLRVRVGSTLVWTNEDPIEHNVTSVKGPQRFASRNFGQGGSFEVRVSRPGVIDYECTIHPVTMNGAIEVVS
jgi:plastocyanin